NHFHMNLKEWKNLHALSLNDIAAGLGVSRATACRLVNGERDPKRDVLLRIYRFTEGEVLPNDIFGIPPEA
ncbi:MAG: helix-turn-helix domain-containing protein, partial [Rhodospirillales bacterium]|nr:helix-turn-helix domain-containing protein [Rhodospirillales bacterium]